MSNPTEQASAVEPTVEPTATVVAAEAVASDAAQRIADIPGTPEDRTAQDPSHPHGYTLADEEIERLEAKRASGDVLDPIALNDPSGQSVERVILRVGATVVAVLVVGILLAQVACKNFQMAGVMDFSTTGVTGETLDGALKNGIVWGGEIVKFPGTEEVVYDREAGAVTVRATDESSRTLEQLASTAQSRAYTLSMSVFEDASVNTVSFEVAGHVSEETGAFSGKDADPLQTVFTVTWTRSADDPASFTCTAAGYDPAARLSDSALASAEAAK